MCSRQKPRDTTELQVRLLVSYKPVSYQRYVLSLRGGFGFKTRAYLGAYVLGSIQAGREKIGTL